MSGRMRAAEAVAAGHPDKLADAIADELVDLASSRSPRALVGVEVAVHRDRVFVTGRIAGDAVGRPRGVELADVEAVVRRRYAVAGHGSAWGPAPEALRIECDLDLGPLVDGEAEFRECSDDQSICTGYAVDLATTGFLPPEQWLAHRIVRGLGTLRSEVPALLLGPDAKAAVLCAEEQGGLRLEAATISLQQRVGADEIATWRRVVEVVRAAVAATRGAVALPGELAERILVNGAGNFECGGTNGDNGLSGKKLVVDAYGPRVPIGGGALSGKDFFKADRAGAIAARRIALGLVRSGAVPEALVELLWRPGDREARISAATGPGGIAVDDAVVAGLGIDRTLVGSGTRWPALVRRRLASYAIGGHFGGEQPWEAADAGTRRDRRASGRPSAA